jgi:hypothetical protein
MNLGLSDRIRALARAKYVDPALRAGKGQFSIRVRDLLGDLHAEGFPARHTPQICTALQTSKFLRENGLEIEEVEGPPSKMSPTVVVRYRVANPRVQSGDTRNPLEKREVARHEEDPAARALRLTEKLRGMLKEELAEYGGGEAFLRWVRSEDEDAA